MYGDIFKKMIQLLQGDKLSRLEFTAAIATGLADALPATLAVMLGIRLVTERQRRPRCMRPQPPIQAQSSATANLYNLIIDHEGGWRRANELLYLTRSMGATTWQTFRYLRFPAALPVIFGGLKTSATIAATAAIVAEFVGSNKGLGYILLQGTANLDTTRVFAVLFSMFPLVLAANDLKESAPASKYYTYDHLPPDSQLRLCPMK